MTASGKHEVDPQLLPLVEGFPPLDVSAETLAAFRAAFKDMSPMPDPATHADVRVEEIRIPHATPGAGPVRCLLHRPARQPAAAALLHIHGGGYVMGSPEMDVPRNIELVRATGCAILSVDYRLAPEHPHPAGLEDCHVALQWLARNGQQHDIRSGRFGVIGESAGGGLAAALALLARDRNTVPLACQVLIYPMLVPPEHSLDTVAPDPRTGRFIWNRASNQYCWSAYLTGAGPHSESIAGLAANLADLPPAFLAVGDLDLFVHDNLAHAGRLLRAGCPVEAHLYPGAIHGFDRMVDAPVSVRYTRELSDFVRRHLA
jgi:acetyl esterase/lipase